MNNLTRYTLSHDRQDEDWALKNDLTARTVRRFETKEGTTAGGVLADAIGSQGSSLGIHKENGLFPRRTDVPAITRPTQIEGLRTILYPMRDPPTFSDGRIALG